MNFVIQHIVILCSILFSIFILEWILLGFWNKACFSVGIPIFFKNFAFRDSGRALEKIEGLVNSFGEAKGFRNLTGKKVEDNVFFFRVRMDKKNSVFFHGSIRFDFENRIIKLRCLLGFSDLLAVVLMIFLHFSLCSYIGFFSPFLLGAVVIVITEGFSFWKCRKIAKKIEELLCETEN
ncbi:MAG: hypothetical protein K6E22_02610 [Treponema sp.]|nr:hypothetical protein [Treponema sp.]